MTQQKEYHAFISYRHADNTKQGRQWATWLHQAIETYEVPADLVGKKNDSGEKIPSRIYPIFRDEEELPAHADLGSSITKALDSSKILVVLCSPQAVASTYVADEIEHFKRIGKSGKIIAAMIAGEPNTSLDEGKQKAGFSIEDECFPTPLQFEYDNNGNRTTKRAEPIAADFRINNNGKPEQGWTSPEAYRQHLQQAGQLNKKEINKEVNTYQQQLHLMLLKIIAGILGVFLRDLTQRDKEYQLEQERQKAKRLRRWLGVVAFFTILAVCAGIFAYFQQQETKVQLIEANHNFGLGLLIKASAAHKNKDGNRAILYARHALDNLKITASEDRARAATLMINSTQTPIHLRAPNFPNHGQNGNNVVFSPNGKMLASGRTGNIHGDKNEIILWDMATGEQMQSLNHNSHEILSLAFSPDSTVVIAGIADGTIILWNIATGKQRQSLPNGHSHNVDNITFAPDGTTLASWTSGGLTIILRDIATGKQMQTLKGSILYPFNCVAFSPDGTKLAAGSLSSTFIIWDIKTGKQLNYAEVGLIRRGNIVDTSDEFKCISFSPDGKTLALGGEKNNIIIWDITNNRILNSLSGHSGSINSVSFSPDGKTLASASDDQTIILWDIASSRKKNMLSSHSGEVVSLAFSPDGNTLASRSLDETIILWDITPNINKTLKISRHSSIASRYSMTYEFNSLVFSAKGKTLTLGTVDGSFFLWDIATGKQISQRLNDNPKRIGIVAYSPDGKILAKISNDHTITLGDITTDKPIDSLDGHSSKINSLAFLPDGKTLASGSEGGTFILWDITTGKQRQSMKDNLEGVNSLTFSHNGKTLAKISSDHTITLWDIDTGNQLNSLKIHSEKINIVAFSPDGNTLVTTENGDDNMTLWNIVAGEKLGSIKTNLFTIRNLAFSPNGKTLASVSKDFHQVKITLWDLSFRKTKDQPTSNFEKVFQFQLDGLTLAPTPLKKINKTQGSFPLTDKKNTFLFGLPKPRLETEQK